MGSYWRGIVAVLATLSGASPARSGGAEPSWLTLVPMGVGAGTTVELTLGGPRARDARDSCSRFPGPVPSGGRRAVSPCRCRGRGSPPAARARSGPCRRWGSATRAGWPSTNSRRCAQEEDGDRSGTGPVVTLPVWIDGTIDPATDRDEFRFRGEAGVRVAIAFRSESLGGSVRPALTVSGPDGRERLHDPGGTAEPTLDFVPGRDGAVPDPGRGPRLSSRRIQPLSAGPVHRPAAGGRLSVGPGAGPVADRGAPGLRASRRPAGRSRLRDGARSPGCHHRGARGRGWRQRRLDARRRGHARRLQLPASGGSRRRRVHPGRRRGRRSRPRAAMTPAPRRSRSSPGQTIAGRFLGPGEVDWYSLPGAEGGRSWRSRGSASGPACRWTWTWPSTTARESCSRPSPTRCRPGEPRPSVRSTRSIPRGSGPRRPMVEYALMIRDLYGPTHWGVERTYALAVGPPARRRVVALPAESNGPRGLAVEPGKTAQIDLVVIRRGGHHAPITVLPADLPPGLSSQPVTIAPTAASGTLTIAAAPRLPPGWAGSLWSCGRWRRTSRPRAGPYRDADPRRQAPGRPPLRRPGRGRTQRSRPSSRHPPSHERAGRRLADHYRSREHHGWSCMVPTDT